MKHAIYILSLLLFPFSLLAQTLAELGKLPDNEEARKASDPRAGKRRRTLFGRRKEAV
jgi:hypothetical protein